MLGLVGLVLELELFSKCGENTFWKVLLERVERHCGFTMDVDRKNKDCNNPSEIFFCLGHMNNGSIKCVTLTAIIGGLKRQAGAKETSCKGFACGYPVSSTSLIRKGYLSSIDLLCTLINNQLGIVSPKSISFFPPIELCKHKICSFMDTADIRAVEEKGREVTGFTNSFYNIDTG